jgi:peptidyl-prolyl cis-trans isomerase C
MDGKKWTARSLAGAALLACVAGRGTAQTQPASATITSPAAKAKAPAAAKPPAVVNGEVIPQSEFDLALKQVGQSAVALPEDKLKQARMDVLALLIDDVLMNQFLVKYAQPAPKSEVDQRIAELMAGLQKQNKSLADFLRETSQTEATLRADIGHRLQWELYAKGRISDDVTEKYYKENKDFFDGVTVRASHIVLRVPPTASEAEKAAARKRLQDLHAQVVANKLDFAEAAKQYSQCPTGPNGGDLGFFPRKWVVDEAFAKAAFALKVGEVSDVVQTDYGLHLIKLAERKPGATPSDYAKMKEVVREVAMEEYRQAVLAHQRKTAKIEINLP